MNRKTTFLMATMLGVAVAAPSMAHPADHGHGPQFFKPGLLSERCLTLRYQRGLERLAKLDLNGDREVDAGEHQTHRLRVLERFDRDGDGRLSPA